MNQKSLGFGLMIGLVTLANLSNVFPVHAGQAKGTIHVDGSSTVFPITEAVAEEFGKTNKDVRVTVGISGTGGGFKKFIAHEIEIANASRRMKPEEEKLAKEAGVAYTEFAIAFDGISIIVNKNNTWVDHLTTDELKALWGPNSTVKTWKDIRSTWPNEAIRLYGPGTDSGTFDFFTEAINGKSGSSRTDFMKSEDDNVIVQGVAGDKNALGYFGYAYFAENQEKLKVVPIKTAKATVTPSPESITAGTYQPLSRKLYLYVTQKALETPVVKEFLQFYLTNAPTLVKQVGYMPLKDPDYKAGLATLTKSTVKKG